MTDADPKIGPVGEVSTPRDGRLVSVDILRGVAALAVVIAHLQRPSHTGFDLRFLTTLPFQLGVLGVPMFIVISGFCIHSGYARRLARGQADRWSWKAFWKRRFVRLYPTYLAAIALSLAIGYALSVWSQQPSRTPLTEAGDVITHLLMVHNLTPYAWGLHNPPFWTLGMEEQLYLLFAVIVLLRARVSAVTLLWIGLAVAIVWRLGFVWLTYGLGREPLLRLGPITLCEWGYWPFGWWFLWLLGAVAAEAHVGLIRLPRWCTSWRLIVAATVVTGFTHSYTLGRYAKYWLVDEGREGFVRAVLNSVVAFSELAFVVGCFALLLRLIRIEQTTGLTSRLARGGAALGLISYSLYLTHQPLLHLMEECFGVPETLIGVATKGLVYVTACVAFAAVFFLVCERPFLARQREPATRRGQSRE